MIKLRFRSGNMRFSAWHLLPTIRLGFWPEKNGGFLAFTFLKFDACLTWAVTPNVEVTGAAPHGQQAKPQEVEK